MKKTAILLCVILLVFAFSACENEKKSGTFLDYVTAPVATFNMYTTTDISAYILSKWCTVRLYTALINESGNGYYYADGLANGDPVSLSDGTEWEITLRDDFSWQNGEKITADDFIYSMKQLLSPEAQNVQASVISSSAYARIKNASSYLLGECAWEDVGFAKLDDYKIKLTTEKPVSALLLKRTFEMPYTMLVYEPLFESLKNENGVSTYGTSLDSFESAGAFFLTDWQPDSRWEFTQNPDYPFSELYSLEKIVVSCVPDANAATELFLNGRLDRLDLSFEQWEQFEDDPRVKDYWNNSLQYFFVNLGNPSQNGLLGELDFRRALYYGADRVALSSALNAIPATRIVRKAVIGNPDTGLSFVDTEGAADYIDDGYTVFSAEKANEYLAKAYEKCGLDKAQVEIYFGETATHPKIASEIMQSQYEKVFPEKLSVTLRSVPSSMQFNLRRWNPDDPTAFELSIGSVTPSADAPHYTFQYYTSTYSPPRFKYSNAEFDEIYEKAAATDDSGEECALCRRLEKMLLDELVVIPLYEIPSKTAFSGRVTLPTEQSVNALGFAYEYSKITE